MGALGVLVHRLSDDFKTLSLLVLHSALWRALSWTAVIGLTTYIAIIGIVQLTRHYHPLFKLTQITALVVGGLAVCAFLVRLTIGDFLLQIKKNSAKKRTK
jgi:hypothetical protein